MKGIRTIQMLEGSTLDRDGLILIIGLESYNPAPPPPPPPHSPEKIEIAPLPQKREGKKICRERERDEVGKGITQIIHLSLPHLLRSKIPKLPLSSACITDTIGVPFSSDGGAVLICHFGWGAMSSQQ